MATLRKRGSAAHQLELHHCRQDVQQRDLDRHRTWCRGHAKVSNNDIKISIDTIELYERNMIDGLALRLVHGELPVGS
jgi:hypothetical protein